MRRDGAFLGTAVVVVSAAVNVVHTASHAGQHVMSLPFWQLAFNFLVPGSDNVFAQPPGTWRSVFVVTAVLLSLLQAAGVAVGQWVARRTPQAATGSSGRRVTGGLSGSRRRTGSDPR